MTKYVNKNLKFGLRRDESILGKGENADNQHLLLFPQCFQNPFVSGLLKVRVVLLGVKHGIPIILQFEDKKDFCEHIFSFPFNHLFNTVKSSMFDG